MRWVCKRYDLRDKHFADQDRFFDTFEEAEKFYKQAKVSDAFAGLGGMYRRYYAYPVEVN